MRRPEGHALILAAGRGTRLLPITEFVPKPLFYLLGIPAIESVLQRLSVPEIKTKAVNVFHLKQKMLEWLRFSEMKDHVMILEEEVLLGTGGALKNAFEHLGYDRPILVYNADIVCSIDPALLLRHYFSSGQPESLLLVHDHSAFNKLLIKENKVISFDTPGENTLAYTGICVISPDLFRDLPIGPCSLVEIWKKAIGQGKRIEAVRPRSMEAGGRLPWTWEDIGTPCGYLRANWHLLAAGGMNGRWISPSAHTGSGLKLEGRVIIGDRADIGEEVFIRDSIIWPDTEVERGAILKNSVVTPFGTLFCQPL